MTKKNKLKIILKIISALTIIIVTIITKAFGLLDKKEQASKSVPQHNNSIKQDSGSIELNKSQNQYNNDIRGNNNTIVNGDKTETINVHNETKK